jgi:hypothetical protein
MWSANFVGKTWPSLSTMSIHLEAGHLDNLIIFLDENFLGSLYDLPASYHDIQFLRSWRWCIAR